MELYAAGFNAWGQLNFPEQSSTIDDEPDDLYKFSPVLRTTNIENVEAFLTYTFVKTASRDIAVGYVPETHYQLQNLCVNELQAYHLFAEASNSDIVVFGEDATIRHYPNVQEGGFRDREQKVERAQSAREREALIRTYPNIGKVRQLLAYETGFIILTWDGKVFTWGDERYTACLGRDVTPENPANKPCLVSDLIDLPTGEIVKIAANGYTLAALTSGNDLYCWGGHPAQAPIVQGLSGYPTPVVVGDNDVADVGVGESHMIALTTDGRVFVIGDNKNGQLGLDTERAADWTKVDLSIRESQKVRGVTAGPRSSFIIVEKIKHSHGNTRKD